MDYKSVENILQKAMDFASEQEHEYVTLEHILLQLIKSKPILKLCEEVQVDVTSLQEDLENYLEGDEDNLKGQNGAKGAPKKTISVERCSHKTKWFCTSLYKSLCFFVLFAFV